MAFARRPLHLASEVLLSEPNIGYCWYCSEVQDLGDPDHVIPGTLFPHKNQSTLTVPCCQACNTKKSHGETELAAYLLARKESGDHPAAQHMWPEVEKAVRKNLSRVGRAAANATWQPYFTSKGLYLGHEMTADIGDVAKPIRQSLRYIVHGLHVISTSQLLPQGTPVEALIIPPEQYLPTLRKLGPILDRGPYGVGPDQATVVWAGRVDDRNPPLGLWLIEFFEGVLVAGIVGVARPAPQRSAQRRVLLKGADKQRAERRERLGILVARPDNYLDMLGTEISRGPGISRSFLADMNYSPPPPLPKRTP